MVEKLLNPLYYKGIIMKLSVVVPVYNEEGNVVLLYQEIMAACRAIGTEFEIIFIDDGSQDKTSQLLKTLSKITIITLRRNFGQTAALDAGIRVSSGDIIITMDGDRQNNPENISLLLEKIHEGNDVVVGWRWQRMDNISKRFISAGARILRRVIAHDRIHDAGCGLKAFRRECFDQLDLYGEMHRVVPAILASQGFRVTEVRVDHRPRVSGKTKYTFSRTLKGFLDILSVWFWQRYSARPLHLFGGAGVLLVTMGMILISGLFLLRLLGVIRLAGSIWPLASFFMFLVGVQLLIMGFLGDVITKSYYAAVHGKPYVIKSVEKKS